MALRELRKDFLRWSFSHYIALGLEKIWTPSLVQSVIQLFQGS